MDLKKVTCAWFSAMVLSTTCMSAQSGYQSPYTVAFTAPIEELCAIDSTTPRNDPRLQSSTPFSDWYSPRIRNKFGAWGPAPRHYPAIAGFDTVAPEWKRQRVLAVAYRLIGLPYQHHHIPAWDPPHSWPWKPVKYGKNSPGVDCSDFTSWVYNYGLGIHLNTGVGQQAQSTRISGPGDIGSIAVKSIHDQHGYDDLISRLKAGDLLYIRNKKGKVGHVIMWVGEYGRSPDSTPLVIDCTGLGHLDSNGNQIPIGVHLRPFGKKSWYYNSFAHAHRIIGEPLLSSN